jgi:hypothetical protein
MPGNVAAASEAADGLALIDVTDTENAGARSGHCHFLADILAARLGPAARGLQRECQGVPIRRYPPTSSLVSNGRLRYRQLAEARLVGEGKPDLATRG